MEKNIKIIDEDTIEVEGTKYYAYERDATCVCNYCELASINCKGIPCTPTKRKDGRNVYFTKEHLDMEKRITAPEGYIIKAIDIVNGEAVITFKEKERQLPKSWEEFCEISPGTSGEFYITSNSSIMKDVDTEKRDITTDGNLLPDHATAEAVLALCQLIQLRNCYNGDWVPDWTDSDKKWVILFSKKTIEKTTCTYVTASELYFKSEELRDEFLRNFRDLIEKLKPLYGIKEGGEE